MVYYINNAEISRLIKRKFFSHKYLNYKIAQIILFKTFVLYVIEIKMRYKNEKNKYKSH